MHCPTKAMSSMRGLALYRQRLSTSFKQKGSPHPCGEWSRHRATRSQPPTTPPTGGVCASCSRFPSKECMQFLTCRGLRGTIVPRVTSTGVVSRNSQRTLPVAEVCRSTCFPTIRISHPVSSKSRGTKRRSSHNAYVEAFPRPETI